MDTKDKISETTERLLTAHRSFSKNHDYVAYPDAETIVRIIDKIKDAIFPGYYNEISEGETLEGWLKSLLTDIHSELSVEIEKAVAVSNVGTETGMLASEISMGLIEQLGEIQQLLYKDARAGFDGDPAARSVDEVILTYPGFFAVLVYRIAHYLFSQYVPLIPRIMSEYAHSITGIDVHPGAEIGVNFFIDHGTGVVIGETTVIGNHVKLYQGVTLGALSTRKGQKLNGIKRHPTIEDNVTIYSGASILGGESIISRDSTIGGNAFITKTIPQATTITDN